MPVNPPFRGGILQAGQSLIQFPPPPPNDDQTSWNALIQLLNCTDTSDAGILACARAVSAETLKEILQSTGLSFQSPVADNVTTLEFPAAAYAAGNVSKVPILAGSNFDEGSSFAYGAGENVTEFLASVSLPTTVVERLAELYAPGSPATVGLTTGNQIIAQIITDSSARCPAGFFANLTMTALDVPAWQYLFNATFPNTQHPEYPGLGVYHSSEISLVFGTYPIEDSTPTQARLSRWMQKQWADFVKDPQNGPGWGPYPAVGVLGASEDEAVTTTNVGDLDPICAEWDKLYALG